MMNDILKLGFGVFVVGPRARIENPPAMILLNPGQKRQCGPRDTVDFVNTQVNYKSRHTWRRWDFDDNFAPQCTSFSRPHPGFPPAAGWANAQAQYRNSDHFFILNKIIYPGKMHCKWSFDTLPRHAYPDWDSVYLWYRYGKDFMPWDFTQFTNGALGTGQNRVAPWDSAWWGQVVYLDIKSGKWSRTQDSSFYFYEVFQETYFDSLTGMNVTRDQVRFVPGGKWIRWPRIDNLPFETNNNQDLVGPYNPINMQNVPDPIAVSRGKYPYTDYNLNGQMNDTWTVTQFDPKTFDSWTLTHQTVLNTGDSMYRHAFKRSIQRCITVRQRVKDSSNNETSNPGMQYDALMLDNFDCEHENQVQLAFGQADAYGLGLSGKICQGSAANNFNAQIRFNMGQIGSFPGVVPNCGQSYILMNLDSLADRRDLTPCDLDGFTTFEGGITPGGLPRPNFNTLPDYFPFPPGPWMNPNGTVNVYHYDPFHPLFPTPLPADQEGWVTIGVAIGNGSKDTTLTVLLSTYRNNQGSYAGAGPFGPPNQQPLVLNPFGFTVTGSTFQNGARHNYQFSQATNIRPLQNTNDSLIDIIYTDANYPKCVSSVVWYHRFFRLVNINANFEEFPASCWHRGKGDSITVFYNDSIMDSIRFSAWAWGDGTVTVDSFWYKGGNVTDAFYTNGVRRVRYNIDLLENVVLDSTVWPIRASGIGANDGLRPGQKFAVVPYDTLDFCQTQIQGVPVRNLNPPTYVADTALMFMPIQHKYVRSSWEAAGRGPDASVSTTVHFIATTADCQSRIFKLMPIGVIDTFDTRKSSHNGEFDSLFCENEEVFFYDSVRYWRYDCQTTFLPDNPGRSRPRPTFAVTVFDPNTDPRALLQLDPFDFWRQAEFDPNTIKDSFTITKVLWNPGANRYDTLKRRGAVFAERMYWDFGDGNTYTGTKPSHKYNNFGRYRVRMVTMDSLGWYDTCVRWVNIVKPIARIYSPQLVYGCGQITQFTDTSYIDVGASDPGVDKIVNNQWWFGENKKDTIVPIAINRKNTQWLYRSNGYFTVKLAIETEQGCRDTAYQDVFISGPRPRFRVITDTIGCTPLKVRIINLADSIPGITPGDTPTVETIVYWGDGNQTTILGRNDTVEHIYGDSGLYEIFVAGRDAITGQNTSCPIVYFPDTVDGFNAPIRIRVYEYPVNITGNYRYLCEGEELEITNSSDSNFTAFQYNIYDRSTDILLDSFPGNGPATVGNPIVTKRIFDTSGDYRIVMIPIGFSSNVPLAAQPNCKVTDTIDVLVSNVVADFTIDSVGIPTFKFTNTSTNAEAYEWYLYTDSTRTTIRAQKLGTLNDPNFEYNLGNEKGKFVVCLKAITADSLGSTGPCEDTTCKVIINEFTTDIKIFNVFTPNNDGSNDVFKVDIEGSEEYEIFIYNRWGGLVYESTDFSKSWNGKVMNEGAESPAGVYYYIINYKLKAQDKKSVNGTVTLMK
jgi:gliding motility-associated-like protein